MEAPQNTSNLPLGSGREQKGVRFGKTFQAPAAGGSPEKQARSLDLWTLGGGSVPEKRPLDEPYLELKVVDCGGGNADAWMVTREKGFRPGRGRKNSCAAKKLRSEMLPEDLTRSISRARKLLRQKCMCLGVNNLLTLTFRAQITDRRLAWDIVGDFFRMVKLRFPSFEYVVIMELHKSGCIHFHVGVHGFWPAASFRFLWHRAIRRKDRDSCWEKSPGNVDFKMQRYGDVRRAARYLAKYFGKDFDQGDLNAKRFASSKGIAKPKVTVLYLDIGTPRLAVVRYLQSLSGGELARVPRTCQVAGYEVELFELQTATMPP